MRLQKDATNGKQQQPTNQSTNQPTNQTKNKQSTPGYLNYHTIENHTIYKEKAQQQTKNEKWGGNLKTANYTKHTQTRD